MHRILVVDNSALMRKIMCDIIDATQGFSAADRCPDADSALYRIRTSDYDAVTINVALINEDVQAFLERLRLEKPDLPIIAITTSMEEDLRMTAAAFEYGKVQFVIRPFHLRSDNDSYDSFVRDFLSALAIAVDESKSAVRKDTDAVERLAAHLFLQNDRRKKNDMSKDSSVLPEQPPVKEKKQPLPDARHAVSDDSFSLIAIASSTGGPQALHTLLPMLPARLGVPVVIVQHMPSGFTASLSERLDTKSRLPITEAKDGEVLEADHVYIAPGGHHLKISENSSGKLTVCVFDAPPVRNLRPCADVMYESLAGLHSVHRILCVVLTGMGSDGTIGITNLRKKKELYVITQDEASCVVYGMPKSAYQAGLSDEVEPLCQIAGAIVKKLGV